MRMKRLQNGTGAYVFVMDTEPDLPLPVNGRWFHRTLTEAVLNASALDLVVYEDFTVITAQQHQALHRTHGDGTQVGHDGTNRCLADACERPVWFNMVGRTHLDVALGRTS